VKERGGEGERRRWGKKEIGREGDGERKAQIEERSDEIPQSGSTEQRAESREPRTLCPEP